MANLSLYLRLLNDCLGSHPAREWSFFISGILSRVLSPDTFILIEIMSPLSIGIVWWTDSDAEWCVAYFAIMCLCQCCCFALSLSLESRFCSMGDTKRICASRMRRDRERERESVRGFICKPRVVSILQ